LAKVRSAVIVLREDEVALIRRVRGGEVYYLFPGGGVETGETPEEAAVREAHEELGLAVRLDRLIAVVEFDGSEQYYYRATITSGEFGSGTGEELSPDPGCPAGSYTPVWMDIDALVLHDVRPGALVRLLSSPASFADGPPLLITEVRGVPSTLHVSSETDARSG
jgi:8-oxo-dGTP pyrophosphatase MutT (NUDIX family)